MICLIRHGETVFNAEGRYQGHVDSPLTERGRAQAMACAATLAGIWAGRRPPPIWASPLGRAVATAGIVQAALPGATLRLDPRLREISMGQWDGLTRAEIAAGWPGVRKRHPPREWMLHAPGGEGRSAVLARLAAVLAEARAAEEVILVGHGMSGRLLRGLHAGLSLAEALHLEAVQGVVYRLDPGGGIVAL